MSKSHVSYDRALGDRYYGRSINPKTAFEIGYEEATQGKGDGGNKVREVKNNYEQKLADYLKALPEDPDFSGIPQNYRTTLSEYLSNQKHEYVRAANVIDKLRVGTQDYMDTISKMNNIKSSFETLDKQFKLYNTTKKSVIEDIEGQAISLYGDNQANVNLLRGIFNEEYDLEIDETGNLYFIGDDGKVGLNDLPEYGMKDFATAEKMVTMGVQAYQNGMKTGYVLKPSDIMYHQYSNKLTRMISEGGRNTLMSVLYDGLVGDIVLANDPAIKHLITGYENGDVGFDELTKVVVDKYMDTLAQQSGNGAKRTKVNPSKTGQTTSRQKVLMKRLMDDRGTTVDKNYVSKMLSGSYYHIIGPFNDGSYQIYDRRTSTPTNINATYEIPNLDLNEQDGLLPIIKELIESGAIK
tara:strand:+ start:213 stop:1442 length:1230 start_codon:yes stop_codon:yes gene_type:complete